VVGVLEDGVKMTEAAEAAFHGNIQDLSIGHLELFRGVTHPHTVEPFGRRATGGSVQHARNMFGAASRQTGQCGSAFGKKSGVFAPADQGPGKPAGQAGVCGELSGLVGTGFAVDEMEKIQQKAFDVEQARRIPGEFVECRVELLQLVRGHRVMAGHGRVFSVPKPIILPEVAAMDMGQHIRSQGDVFDQHPLFVGAEAVGIPGADHDQDPGMERVLLPVDPMGAGTVGDPEDLREVVPVQGEGPGSAQEAAAGPAGMGTPDFAPTEKLHGINIPEVIVIGQVDSPGGNPLGFHSMNTISFMTANFVARELNYHMTRGWGEGDSAVSQYFRTEETFAGRFDAMLGEITPLGFKAVDLWGAHLNPDWATPRQIEQAAAILSKRGLTVSSLAFWLPADLGKLDKIADIAKALGVRIIGGGCAPEVLGAKRSEFIKALEKHDLVYGYENHPEKSADDLLAKVGDDAGGRIGVTIDTGWFGTYRCSAPDAIRQLAGRLVHVHLKDICEPHIASGHKDIRESAPGKNPTLKEMGHETCALGEGVVDVEGCVAALKATGYKGGISIEHEPEDHNPLEDVKLGYGRLQKWLKK